MNKIEYPEWFETLWLNYPKRAGGNPKRPAFKALQARVNQGYELEEIINGVMAYAEFCEKTGKIGSEFVKQAKTFFGPDEWFLEDWTPPQTPAQKPDWAKLPFNDDELMPFAALHGLPKPNQGEYYPQYRRRLQIEIERRLNQ